MIGILRRTMRTQINILRPHEKDGGLLYQTQYAIERSIMNDRQNAKSLPRGKEGEKTTIFCRKLRKNQLERFACQCEGSEAVCCVDRR